ncbi:MAG: C39 family peptidase [Candidatus Binatia bacterium]
MKKLDKEVPFYSNTSDDTHCFQAALRMVMKFFWPAREFSWDELDKITAKVQGLWTWPMAGMLWLKEQGMEVKNIEVADYQEFIRRGGEYLIEEYGEEFGRAQIEHCDIEQERNLAREFVKKIDTVRATPIIEEVKQLLNEGYLVVCNVNSRTLDNREGYSGHFVVVKGYDDTHLLLHDPGLPPLENRKVDVWTFERAWAYPSQKAKNIMAFRVGISST